MKWRIATKGAVLISVPLIFMLGFIALVRDMKARSERVYELSTHSKEVIREAQELLTILVEAETGVRGYAISGDPVFAAPFEEAKHRVPETVGRLQALVSDDPAQAARARRLGDLAARNVALRIEVAGLIAAQEKDQAVRRISSGEGKRLMDDFRHQLGAFLATEEQLESARREMLATSWQRINWLLFGGVLIQLAIAAGLAVLFSRSIGSRLTAVTDNVRRLAEGRELSPPVVGNDEISQLDCAFREMAQALEYAASRERAVIAHALDVICSINAEGVFTSVSPASLKIWGYAPEELVGRSFLDLTSPEDAESAGQKLGTIVAGHQTTEFENRCRRKDGTPVEMMWSASWVEAERLVFCVARDITQRKQAEIDLRQYADEISDLYNHAPCGYHSLDRDGYFLRINDTELDWLGYEREEVVGRKRFLDFVTDEGRGRFQQEFPEFRARGWVRDLQFEMVRKDGTHFSVLLNATATYNDAGEYLMSRSTLHDITERRRAEVALLRAHEDLEVRVRERTAELATANQELLSEIAERRRAEAMLESYAHKLELNNRELQDFAFVASHDLQEPLRKILAFGDRLKLKSSGVLGEQGLDYLGRMQQASKRMQTLIDDLLTFSRVTTRAQPFEPVDLRRITHEVLGDLEVRLAETGGRVEVRELPAIEADPTQMRQLLQNLIGNALKFHRSETPPVVIVSGELMPDVGQFDDGRFDDPAADTRRRCRILVEDNGIGFDEKYLDRIFTVFQRLHGRGEYEGTGVGLAICRKIVERHGGEITARSSPGQGTTFIVTLPETQSEVGAPV